ncbi:MAG: hypothetical protein Q8O87_00640 [bacterium]|nr:hypothetical protein [bacterium]
MIRYLAILLIAAVISIAVFGFVGMQHHAIGSPLCIVSTMQGGDCAENNILSFITHHISILQTFSATATGLLAVALLLSLMAIASSAHDLPITSPIKSRAIISKLPKLSTSATKIRSWLSLHRNSPNLA